MMTKNEKLQTIREMLGSSATLLDAAYVFELMEERGISIEDAADMHEAEFLGLVDEALRYGAEDIREVLSCHGDVPSSVHQLLDERRLREALEEWLGTWDHVVAYGTSETCLAGAHQEALDDLERAVVHGPREAVEEFANWWARAYTVYLKARKAGKLDYACELLLTGNLDAAEELVQ